MRKGNERGVQGSGFRVQVVGFGVVVRRIKIRSAAKF